MPQLHALSLLGPSDVMPLAAYCTSFGMWRTATEKIAEMEARDPVTKGMIVRPNQEGRRSARS